HCRRSRPSSTRSKTSGSSSATTGSPTASSNPTTTSSITAALPGTVSSTSRGQSCRSACAIGHIGPDQRDLVLLGWPYARPSVASPAPQPPPLTADLRGQHLQHLARRSRQACIDLVPDDRDQSG